MSHTETNPRTGANRPVKSDDVIGAYVTAAEKAEAVGYDPTSTARRSASRQATLATTTVWGEYTEAVAREVQETIDAAAFGRRLDASVATVCRRVARELAAHAARKKYGGDGDGDGDGDGELVTDGGVDVRISAEIDDSADDPAEWVVLPPTVQVTGDVPAEIVAAVRAAVAANPNACDEPRVIANDDWEGAGSGSGSENAVAFLVARYNELPVPTGDGPEDYAWLPPYRAREEIDAVLFDRLPREYDAEAWNDVVTAFYTA